VELTNGDSLLPSWAEVPWAKAVEDYAPISIDVPTFTLRVQAPSGQLINFEEIAAFAQASSASIAVQPSRNPRCRSSTVYAVAQTNCGTCSDGAFISSVGCHTSDVDTAPYMIFSLTGSVQPRIVALQPRPGFMSRLRLLNVTLLDAPTGRSLWSGNVTSSWGGSRASSNYPVVLNVSAPQAPFFALRVSKSSAYQGNVPLPDATPFAIDISALRVFSNESGRSFVDMARNASCFQRSFESNVSTCAAALDGDDLTAFTSKVTAPPDISPEFYVFFVDSSPVDRIEIAPAIPTWWRSGNISLQLLTRAGAVSWGGVFGGS
jgi:hypothetical protein